MAVHQTPFNYSWYGHSKDFHLRSLRSTIIFCSVATIPLSGPYSCIVPRSPWTLRVQRL